MTYAHSIQPPPVGFEAALGSLIAGQLSFDLHFQPIVDLSRGVIAGYVKPSPASRRPSASLPTAASPSRTS